MIRCACALNWTSKTISYYSCRFVLRWQKWLRLNSTHTRKSVCHCIVFRERIRLINNLQNKINRKKGKFEAEAKSILPHLTDHIRIIKCNRLFHCESVRLRFEFREWSNISKATARKQYFQFSRLWTFSYSYTLERSRAMGFDINATERLETSFICIPNLSSDDVSNHKAFKQTVGMEKHKNRNNIPLCFAIIMGKLSSFL